MGGATARGVDRRAATLKSGMRHSGHADLPLHGGHVPAWLAQRMTALGTAITESILLQYGPSEFLTRLSDPFWFQALGSVMGMDWHSSGITTSVMGALKRGLNPKAADLGIYICGGRGRHSRNTPGELRSVAERHGLDGEEHVLQVCGDAFVEIVRRDLAPGVAIIARGVVDEH